MRHPARRARRPLPLSLTLLVVLSTLPLLDVGRSGTVAQDATPATLATPVASPGAAASPTPRPSTPAGDALARAAQRLADTQSAHFTLEVDGTTYIDEGETIQLLSAEGDLLRPDRVRASFDASLRGLATVTINLITVGDQNWTTDLVTGDWVTAPAEIGYDPRVLFDEQTGLGPVLLQATNPETVGDEEINGRDATHVRATVSQEVIGPVTAGTMGGSEVVIEVWVDRETGDALRATVAEQPNPDTDDPATWTLDLSRINEPVTIEPPI